MTVLVKDRNSKKKQNNCCNEHGGAKFERTDAQIMCKFKKKFGLTFSKFIPIFTEFFISFYWKHILYLFSYDFSYRTL